MSHLQATALDAFWASLHGLPGLSPAESELLEAILAVAEKARQLLPQGVSLQDWAERRVPAHLVPEVNRSGFIFITSSTHGQLKSTSLAGPSPSCSPGAGLTRAEAGLETLPTIDKKATLARPSVVRSLVAGVKSFSAGLLGVVFRPLSRKAPAAELRVPENTFYFDPVAQRWRQQGMEDVDTSNIDPATGRQKQLNLSAMELPPMGPPPTAPAACSRQGPASLYVDPLAPPRAAAPAPAPMKPQQFVAPPVEHGQGKVAIHAATGCRGGEESAMPGTPGPVESLATGTGPLAPDAVAAPEPAPEPMVRVASPGHGPCGPGDGSLVPSFRSQAGRKYHPQFETVPMVFREQLQSPMNSGCGRCPMLGILPVPGYVGHKNHGIHLTTGEVGCFMSHFTIWHHMVQHQLPAALILEDDFDLQPDFASKLGSYLEEARGYDWNLMYVGRSPTEADWSRLSDHVVEPGYTLWTVGRPS
eukprot:s1700_g2.t4